MSRPSVVRDTVAVRDLIVNSEKLPQKPKLCALNDLGVYPEKTRKSFKGRKRPQNPMSHRCCQCQEVRMFTQELIDTIRAYTNEINLLARILEVIPLKFIEV